MKFALLFCMYFWHLLGFDHEKDNGEMREKKAKSSLNLSYQKV